MRQFVLLIILAVFISCSTPAHAAESPAEYQVKAAYLFNFAKFITWPETVFSDKESPFVIGILGKNEFSGYLHPLTSKTVRNRPVAIKHFKSAKDVSACQILYLSSSEDKRLTAHLKELGTQAIVTVSDGINFADNGGMIQLTQIRGRLRFIINLQQATEVGIKIDSQLLSLAIEIMGENK
jgi:hypothetical protein